MKIYSRDALISAIVRSPRPITLLVGSAFTLPDHTSIGVPGVKEIISKIKSHIDSIDLTAEYESELEKVNESMVYQHGFEFISGWDSQDSVNNIINNAVKEAFDSETETWGLLKGWLSCVIYY